MMERRTPVGSDFIDGLNQLLQSADSPQSCALPNLVYTDSSAFEFERDHVLTRSWAAIGYASDLPAPGFAEPVNFMGLPLLIVRDRDGALKVFHNVCSHRGMVLVREPARLRAVIRCPYHSWPYDFDGKLLSTPLIGGTDRNDCDGFKKGEHGLRVVACAVWMDIVFVTLSDTAAPFEHFVRSLEDRWKHWFGSQDRDRLQPSATGSKLELTVDCNWKLAVENYCEAYHLPWVHPALNSYSPLEQHFNIMDGDGIAGQGSQRYELTSVAGIELPRFEGWPSDQRNYAEYIALYPNTLLGLQADHFFSVIVLPDAPDRSRERLQISYVGAAATDDSYAACRAAVLKSWDTVFREDVFAVEGMQFGRQSSGFDGGVLTPVQDVATQHFHRWVAARYREGIP